MMLNYPPTQQGAGGARRRKSVGPVLPLMPVSVVKMRLNLFGLLAGLE